MEYCVLEKIYILCMHAVNADDTRNSCPLYHYFISIELEGLTGNVYHCSKCIIITKYRVSHYIKQLYMVNC